MGEPLTAAGQHRLHALRTTLMAISLTLVLLAAHAADRLSQWLPAQTATIPAVTSTAAATSRCAPVSVRSEIQAVVGHA